jgi:serine/threonine-protein kinase
MSPEQARGEQVDRRSDIFALGIMLFEITTGRRLFKGQTDYETMRLIIDREYPRPSEVRSDYPIELERVVMRALAKLPDDRPPSARALKADLDALVRTHRIDASATSLATLMHHLFR